MMKKLTYLTLVIFLVSFLYLMVQDCFATQWAKTYGGGNWDDAHSIQQTSDGGYIAAGYTETFGAASPGIIE